MKFDYYVQFLKRSKLGPVYSSPEKFKTAALFLRFGLLFTLERNFSKLEEFENVGFSFSCGRKTFWKQSFS